MSWHIRHEGSPATTAVTPNQILQGLGEGVWEVTDEVRGPTEQNWTPLESHPYFEEALADYEPPKRHHDDVEEHLDMNPLIDVALVLLIFFILTTSYDALRKVIDMPSMSKKNNQKQKVLKPEDVKAEFVLVKVSVDGKNTIYNIDGTNYTEDQLVTAMKIGWGEGKRKTIIDAADGVSWGAICAIMDAARAANVADKLMMKAN
jgi:biopolymer transport protein ExbD